jgi:hypothetical protein
LISRHEHEAWDVLLACQGQVRLAPGCHVIGIEMSTALGFGAARWIDLAVLSELLPVEKQAWSRRWESIRLSPRRLQ